MCQGVRDPTGVSVWDREASSHLTENRTIEARKSLMFYDSLVGCRLQKAPVQQTPSWGGHSY